MEVIYSLEAVLLAGAWVAHASPPLLMAMGGVAVAAGLIVRRSRYWGAWRSVAYGELPAVSYAVRVTSDDRGSVVAVVTRRAPRKRSRFDREKVSISLGADTQLASERFAVVLASLENLRMKAFMDRERAWESERLLGVDRELEREARAEQRETGSAIASVLNRHASQVGESL